MRRVETVMLSGLIAMTVCLHSRAAVEYTADGTLDSREELQRWMINRARHGPEPEADRLGMTNELPGGHPDYDVCTDTNLPNDFGTTTSEWAVWTRPLAAVAPNARLTASAQKHSADMMETDVFSHQSPSSKYYPIGSWPWDRTEEEGYTNAINGYCENIAFGARGSTGGYPSYGRLPADIHDALFIDTSSSNCGHRKAIINATAREIGIANARTNIYGDPFGYGTDYYWTYDYDTQDFGRRPGKHFFTGTIFHDADTNGVYDEGEGIGNVEVHLWNGSSQAAWYDVSESSGCFAVPIEDLPDGAEIAVELFHPGPGPVTLTLPMSYYVSGNLTLTAGEARVCGSFIQPSGEDNVGFRNLSAVGDAATAGIQQNNDVEGAFSGLDGAPYRIESSDNGPAGPWISFTSTIASNGLVSFTDSGQGARPHPSDVGNRFYRTVLEKGE